MKSAEEPNNEQDRERNPEQPQQGEPSHTCTPGIPICLAGNARGGARFPPLTPAGTESRELALLSRELGRARGLLPFHPAAIMASDACRQTATAPDTGHENMNDRLLHVLTRVRAHGATRMAA
jgi:hypothetical protein